MPMKFHWDVPYWTVPLLFNLNMFIRRLSRNLKIGWFAAYVAAGIIAVFFETGCFSKGLVTDDKTLYFLEIIGVLFSLALIPFSLRGSKRKVDRLHIKGYSYKRIIKAYLNSYWRRLTAYFILIAGGTLLYYLIDDTIGLYIAGIGALCSLFCYPSVRAIESDISF